MFDDRFLLPTVILDDTSLVGVGIVLSRKEGFSLLTGIRTGRGNIIIHGLPNIDNSSYFKITAPVIRGYTYGVRIKAARAT
ncbi:hypothetical protein [Paenibacillus nasutitermitis]|uniref:hypothetical protein n=1 Tax=Paenibacillus nasutitermitis TaxID=1652958 RepID=UPI001E3DB7B7|nr:hypothetical protein [Paenibacillus nasutitermitis]